MKKITTLAIACCVALGTHAQINSGSPAKPFNSNTGYAAGILPANLPTGGAYGKSQDAANAYNSWKSRFVSVCSGKGSRVLYDDNTSTVSEGIGYGMLLSAYAGDKALFDDLYLFYHSNMDGNNLMNWKIGSCSGGNGGSATDADIDVAMALIVAADQWPSGTTPATGATYKAEAQSLLSHIRAVDVSGNQFNNGDSWNGNCRNPSYQAPAYSRMFGTIENGQASFWNGVTSGSSALVLGNRNANTGLVSNWCDANNFSDNNCNNTGTGYGFDACRNPWRMATDVLWNGTGTASAGADICGKLANWAKNYAANFTGPLSQNAANPSVGPNTGGSYSTFALPFMAAGAAYQIPLNTAYTAVVNLGNNDTYFNSSIRCLTLFMLSGNFWQPGSNILRATASIVTPSDYSSFKQGASVSFSTTTTVSSGTIAKVEYYDGLTLLGSSTTAPYTFATTALTGGNHVITAKAYQATTVVAESGGINILIKGASDIATTGILDMFETSSPLSELTGGTVGATCPSTTTAASAGVYWFLDTLAKAPSIRKYTFTQKGDGVLTYTLSNDQGAYNVIGFNFGQYCMGNKLNNYYLDLRKNATLSFTVSAPATNTKAMQLKITLKDSAGHVLTFNNNIINATTGKPDTANWYKYDIGFSKNHTTTDQHCILKGHSYNYSFDFTQAFTVKDPTKSGAGNINFNNTDFNFAKVMEVDMIPLDSIDTGPTTDPTYQPTKFQNQVLIFSNVVLGNIGSSPDICTTPSAPLATTPVTYCAGSAATALSATGTAGLNLQWYNSPTAGTASSTATIPSTGSAGASMYYVSQKVGLDGTCEGPRTPITVNVVAGPEAHGGSDQIAVTGPSVSLSGTGSATGTWSLSKGPVGATATFSPSANSAVVTANGLSILGTYTFTYSVEGTIPCKTASSNVNVEVTTITAIEDELLSNNVEIYPNPVSDNLHVILDKIEGAKTVKLVDAYGRVVFESSNSENALIPMNNLGNGMYFVQIQAASGTLTKTVIKK